MNFWRHFLRQNSDLSLMKAVIIAVGGEILAGDTLDTNSNFIAEQLKSIGVKVKEIRTISDEVSAIENTFLHFL